MREVSVGSREGRRIRAEAGKLLRWLPRRGRGKGRMEQALDWMSMPDSRWHACMHEVCVEAGSK